MNISEYTYLLANPQKISGNALVEIGEIIEKYPYFQSARALQLKGLKNQNSFLYNDALKVTAAYTSERDMLFEYITSDSFIQNEISQLIQHHSEAVKEIIVESEDVSELVSIDIDNQLKAELRKAEAILNPKLFERKIRVSNEVESGNEEEVQLKVETSETLKIEEELEINKPLPFTKTDTHSFSEWLQLTKTKPIDRNSSEEKVLKESNSEGNDPLQNSSTEKPQIQNTSNSTELKEEKSATSSSEINKKIELIDRFIQDRPRIIPKETYIYENKNLAAPFTQSSDSLMTETLAKVYLQQNNYKKAIQAYKILILKNPEKSGFFADQIRAIEKLINTK